MKALRVEDHGIAVRDIEKPRPGPEAIVRVTLSGVCNTDLEISRGYAGFQGTLGHEFVGVVESLGEARPSGKAEYVDSIVPPRNDRNESNPEPSLTVGLRPTALQAGQRVVGEINAGCGRCNLCLAGDPRHCAQRT